MTNLESKDNSLSTIKLIREDLPALYHSATIESGKAQKALLFLTIINLLILTLAAIFSAINLGALKNDNLQFFIIYAGTAMLVISTIVTFAIEQANYERKWYDGRAIAESIKTLTWRFMMNSEPYKSESNPEERFRNDLHAILKDRKSFAELLGGDIATHQQITDKMRAIMKSDFKIRKQIYLKNRIQSQKKWYSDKSKDNRKFGTIFFWSLISVQILAILISIYFQRDPNFIINPTGILTTIAAGLIAWIQIKQYKTLAESYGLTTHELGIIETKLSNIKSNVEFSNFVLEAETAISREHTVWLARRINI